MTQKACCFLFALLFASQVCAQNVTELSVIPVISGDGAPSPETPSTRTNCQDAAPDTVPAPYYDPDYSRAGDPSADNDYGVAAADGAIAAGDDVSIWSRCRC